MSKFLKSNSPIIVLFIIVIAGFAYPFYSGKWFTPPRLSESDAKCYGIDVPENIEYVRVESFCSCMRMSNIEETKEKSNYCANRARR